MCYKKNSDNYNKSTEPFFDDLQQFQTLRLWKKGFKVIETEWQIGQFFSQIKKKH